MLKKIQVNSCHAASLTNSIDVSKGQLFCHAVILVVASSCFLLAGPVSAERGIHPYVGYSATYDSNVFRLPDNVASKTSDVTQRIEAGLDAETNVKHQVFSAKVSYAHNWYNDYSRLDFDGKNLLFNWNWHLARHLQGNAGYSFTESMAPYTSLDSRIPLEERMQRNLRQQKRGYMDGVWAFHPSWQVRGGYSHTSINYSLDELGFLDRSEDATELGLDYLPSTQSSVGVQLRHISGNLPQQEHIIDKQGRATKLMVDNGYSQNELMGKVEWRLSEKTRLKFLAGQVKRSYEDHPGRDFSGFNARLIGSWAITEKFGVSTNIWREAAAYDSLTAAYTLNRGMSLEPAWNITSKVRMEGMMRYEKRDYQGDIQASLNNGRLDKLKYYSLSLQYIPAEKWRLGLALYRDTRDSNLKSISIYDADYKSNGVIFSSRYQF